MFLNTTSLTDFTSSTRISSPFRWVCRWQDFFPTANSFKYKRNVTVCSKILFFLAFSVGLLFDDDNFINDVISFNGHLLCNIWLHALPSSKVYMKKKDCKWFKISLSIISIWWFCLSSANSLTDFNSALFALLFWWNSLGQRSMVPDCLITHGNSSNQTFSCRTVA